MICPHPPRFGPEATPAAVPIEPRLLELFRSLPETADGIEVLVDCEPPGLAVAEEWAGQIEACGRRLLEMALSGAAAREIDLVVRADLRGATPMVYLSMRKVLAAAANAEAAGGETFVHHELRLAPSTTHAILLARRDGGEQRLTLALELPFVIQCEETPVVAPLARVLVADANPRARRLVRRQLERRGIAVDEASRATEVLAAVDPLAVVAPPDGVLLDEGLCGAARAETGGLLAAIEAVIPAERLRLLSNRRGGRSSGARRLAKPLGGEELQGWLGAVSLPARNAAAESPYSFSL